MGPTEQLHVQKQQTKHKKKMWNMFKVKSNDSTACYNVFIVNFEHIWHLSIVG